MAFDTQEEQRDHDRRQPLSPLELEAIKEQLLESIYADIGRSVVKKVLWVAGAVVGVLFVGFTAAGKIKVGMAGFTAMKDYWNK